MNSFVAKVGYSWLEILITFLPIRHGLSKQTRSDFVITGMLLERFSENQEITWKKQQETGFFAGNFQRKQSIKTFWNTQ